MRSRQLQNRAFYDAVFAHGFFALRREVLKGRGEIFVGVLVLARRRMGRILRGMGWGIGGRDRSMTLFRRCGFVHHRFCFGCDSGVGVGVVVCGFVGVN